MAVSSKTHSVLYRRKTPKTKCVSKFEIEEWQKIYQANAHKRRTKVITEKELKVIIVIMVKVEFKAKNMFKAKKCDYK